MVNMRLNKDNNNNDEDVNVSTNNDNNNNHPEHDDLEQSQLTELNKLRFREEQIIADLEFLALEKRRIDVSIKKLELAMTKARDK